MTYYNKKVNPNEQSSHFPGPPLNRREFISKITQTIVYSSSILIGVPSSHSLSTSSALNAVSTVGIQQSKKVWEKGKLNKKEIKNLLNQGMLNITGYQDITKAWNSLFSPKDIVAIKINSISRGSGSTKPELSYSVGECLHQYVTIPLENIIVFDRFEDELIGAGYNINQSNKGIKVFATHAYPFSQKMKNGDVETPLTDIIAKRCTALINLSLLKTHSSAGISLSFKNHYGSIPKTVIREDSSGYHSNDYNYLIYLNSLLPIKEKTRLCIIDALVGQFNGGPDGNPKYQWKFNGLVMGVDPVAVDTVGLTIINAKRIEKNLPPLRIKYLKWAEEEGLGITNQESIKLYTSII